MNKINKTRIHNAFAILTVGYCSLCTTQVWALPTDATNMTVTNGAGNYSYAGTAGQGLGTLTFEQNNSVASFAVEPIKIEATETLNVMPGVGGSSDWVGVIRDDSGMQSELNGTLAAGMRVFFLNSNGMLTGNNFKVDFSGLTNAAGGLVLSTHTLDPAALAQGVYQLDSTSPGAAIQLQGLQVNGQGAEVLVLADQLAIDGAVDVPAGQFHGVSAGAVDVTFGVGNMILVKGAVPLAQGVAGITSTAASSVAAGHVNLQAWVADPLSLALNNKGLVSATGISVNEQGTISLVGRGGNLVNTGGLDASSTTNGDGTVNLQANIVALGGAVKAEKLQIDIGDEQTNGEFRLLGNGTVAVNSAIVSGLGEINTINGLANYHVEQANAGSAGWLGVASSDWSNAGAVSWNNVSRLIARVDIDNNLRVEQAGSLANVDNTALLRGGARNDTFTIAGTAQLVEGLGGNDLFIMQGGNVTGLVDGGGGIDRIEKVFNVVLSGAQGINGSSDFVNWVNIQSVLESTVPDPIPLPTEPPNLAGVIAPQVAFANVSNMSAASLGLVGAGAEPRLPCGFGSAPISIAGENLAQEELAHEEPCMQDYSGPEFQELISSLIHFDHDSFAITPASAARLEKVAEFFVESNAFNKVVIAGHTDDIGSEVYNLALSERRSASTSRYMQAQGVRPDVIEAFHFGEALPAVANTSAANRAHNRRARIELK